LPQAVRLAGDPPVEIDFIGGGIMDILGAIKREEARLEKQLGKLQHQKPTQ